jgi:HK97 family phage portal protein
MSFLDNVKQSLGYRAREAKPATGYSGRREWGYTSPLAGKTGVMVTPDNALTFSAIYSAVSLLVTTTSSLKLCKFKVDRDGNRVEQNDLFTYVHNYLPNPEMDSRTYNEAMTANLLLRGEAFAENEFNELGEVVRRWPIPSQYITPYRDKDLGIYYYYMGPDGKKIILPAKKIFHVKDFSLDGFRGISRITLAKLGIELGLAQEQLAVALMGNDARPQGVITVPEELDAKVLEEFKLQWEKR